ncbi:predicted protein [Plenodomus lingam JN3]|uniref:Predicted protein n=1 Tax=Leptosphaeria maculans (strain JN3 / isolate v23.1.3 / race Av1-4-5-6-7-8) TaxID=985895 RepID=E5AFK3_LEPMJ|nr:predicted protein [Plenodomus lingam JN3]CBY01992.1 predicted protein [Plenodomus lingam JN3]
MTGAKWRIVEMADSGVQQPCQLLLLCFADWVTRPMAPRMIWSRPLEILFAIYTAPLRHSAPLLGLA